MKVIKSEAYPVNMCVVVAEMGQDDEFTRMGDFVDYDSMKDDLALFVTYKRKGAELAWAILWLAVIDHDKREIDAQLLTTKAATQLLGMAPLDCVVSQQAISIVMESYEKRSKSK